MICKCCGSSKTHKDFTVREDRIGSYYAWCKECCKAHGRTVDYPPVEKRGYGKLTIG